MGSRKSRSTRQTIVSLLTVVLLVYGVYLLITGDSSYKRMLGIYPTPVYSECDLKCGDFGFDNYGLVSKAGFEYCQCAKTRIGLRLIPTNKSFQKLFKNIN